MLESSRFRTPVESQRVHGCQTLLKWARQDIHLNFPLTQEKLSYKTSLLVRWEILALFGNLVTPAYMSACHNSENFQQHVQTPLSQKSETFSSIFIAFFQFTSNLIHFKKKHQWVNVFSGGKHRWNHKGRTFIFIFHSAKTTWLTKQLFYSDVKP